MPFCTKQQKSSDLVRSTIYRIETYSGTRTFRSSDLVGLAGKKRDVAPDGNPKTFPTRTITAAVPEESSDLVRRANKIASIF